MKNVAVIKINGGFEIFLEIDQYEKAQQGLSVLDVFGESVKIISNSILS